METFYTDSLYDISIKSREKIDPLANLNNIVIIRYKYMDSNMTNNPIPDEITWMKYLFLTLNEVWKLLSNGGFILLMLEEPQNTTIIEPTLMYISDYLENSKLFGYVKFNISIQGYNYNPYTSMFMIRKGGNHTNYFTYNKGDSYQKYPQYFK